MRLADQLGLRLGPRSGLSSGLLHYFKMEESSGSRLDTMAGAALTVGAGTVSAGTGKLNNGAAVSSGNYLVGNIVSLLSSSFTLGCWVNISAKNNDASNSALFGASTTNAGFDIAFPQPLSNEVQVNLYPTVGVMSYTAGLNVLSDNTFHSVLIWSSGVGGGVQIDATLREASTGAFSSTAGGTESISFSAAGAAFIVDELAVWSRVLSVGERAMWYNGGAGRFYPL